MDGARDQFPQLVRQADDFPSGRAGFKALRTQAIARALSVRDIESSVWLPWENTGKCRKEKLLFGKTRAQLFCLESLALPTLAPGWTNPRKLGAAN